MSERDQPSQSFTDAVLGGPRIVGRLHARLASAHPDLPLLALMAALGTLVFVPFLGAVGLWDPWETHYGEVARQMLHRRDFIYPFWEHAWFFSKPPLTMWLQGLGMLVAGTNRTQGAVALYSEWGMRLPFALLSILALCLLALAVSRLAGRRAGLASGFALATMPLYFLLSRQAVTDTPFVATLSCAMACAMIAQLDPGTRHRAGWWYGFYFFVGLSTLAKGLLGAGLPAVILILYAAACVMPWDPESLRDHVRWLKEPGYRARVRQGGAPMPVLWAQMRRMHLLRGLGVFALVVVPWFGLMIAFSEVDNEGKLFWVRFFVHDHLNRLAAGVHTTTPGGSFTYFIEQGAYALFPWIAAVPGALAVVFGLRRRGDAVNDLGVMAALWAGFVFTLMTLSATRFHHYVFPVLPAAAILIGLFVDRLWREGLGRHGISLLLGLVLFTLVGKDLASHPKHFTDLFVYNYGRPYPAELTTRAASLFGMRTLWTGDLLAILLLAFGAYLLFDTFRGPRRVGARATAIGLTAAGLGVLGALVTRGERAPSLFFGLALVLTALYVGWEATREKGPGRVALWGGGGVLAALGVGLALNGARMRAGGDPLLASLLRPVNLKAGLGMAMALCGGLAGLAALQRARTLLFGTFWAFALSLALWFSWSHWVDLSHHWTQRDLFWRYYDRRGGADEPIAAYLMNWRGETFYSRNQVKQLNEEWRLRDFVGREGREWVLVEQARGQLSWEQVLRKALGPSRKLTAIDPDLNNKFVLVAVD